MGCASSSPALVNGGLVDSAKTAATEMITNGEKTMNEMGDNIAETAGQVKESVVESINGMANSINEVINDGITKIPLKDPSSKIEEAVESQNHLIEENLENLKNEMLTKAQAVGDEADKIADELIKDTEDVVRDAETGIVDAKNAAIETMESVKDEVMDVIKSNDVFSVDSLGTSAPEPEIEKLLNGEPEKPLSPEATPTMGELDDLNKIESEEPPAEPSAPPMMNSEPAMEETPKEAPESVPAEKPMEVIAAEMIESTAAKQQGPIKLPPIKSVSIETKKEDDLVVEDVKDENDENMIGTKLAVVEESCDASCEEEEEESEEEIEEGPSATKWEEMHDIIFKKPILFSHPLNSSIESLMEDEENCALNLSNMYNDENIERHSVQIKIEVDEVKSVDENENKKQIADDDNTVNVIDDLLKSFEKEVEMDLEAVPIVNVEE